MKKGFSFGCGCLLFIVFAIGVLIALFAGGVFGLAKLGESVGPEFTNAPSQTQPSATNAPAPTQEPALSTQATPATPTTTSVAPSAADAEKLRGNKDTNWTHTSIVVEGKPIMAINLVHLTSDLHVNITTSFGMATFFVKDVPQGFLDDWGITGEKIDAAIAAQKADDDKQIAGQVAEEKKKEVAPTPTPAQ